MKKQKQSFADFFKIGYVLKNFVKFTGKNLCQSLFFNNVAGLIKLQALGLQLY